ncbi:SWI/SNF and RSC complexes subunit ssr3 [Zancudomyces culisetae]|uniref:SWI/SNF and RSC complexes subunit ssr3 n=1 Tax=Zancudomyces culisetae TaxID=1213189 RepID=A0A1R1PE07_ZANCU|nr:SWI/SNF and RSC complexes subunit ssr3 [Zancudomyces culisetae]|eukprot:OMH79196.1 SWI/SNF and RSC complexes subunit ssr3 [Zancudomyces culisetae]
MGYLAPIDPFVIEYVIRVDSGPVFKSPHAYDLEVEVEEPSKSRLGPLPSIQTLQKETQAIDEKLDGLMQELHELRAKRDFFNEFSMNPTRFINDAVKIMTRDLQVITGEPSTQLESVLAASMRKKEKDTEKAAKDKEGSGLFELPWVSEAIFHYLATQAEEKTNENITNSFVAGGGNPSATSASITSDGMDRHSSSAIHASQPPSAGVVNAASIAPNAPVNPTQNIPIHPHH